jgi:hypothetical protein
MGKAHGHVSVIEGHAVCDSLSKLLRILAARDGSGSLRGKVRQRDPGQDVYLGG